VTWKLVRCLIETRPKLKICSDVVYFCNYIIFSYQRCVCVCVFFSFDKCFITEPESLSETCQKIIIILSCNLRT